MTAHNHKLIAAAWLAALAAIPAYAADAPAADDVTIVTATRTSTSIDQVASSVTVITAKQLEQTKQSFVVEALRLVPGLFINESGSRGGHADIYMRGGASGATLVLIDGVSVNDPSNPDHSYDITNITVDNVDRIEVLRGSQSTLYGSDAMAGVINIITKRGHGKPTSHVTLGGGRYGTAEGRLDSSGSSKAWQYSASASQFTTAGFPLGELQPGNTHNDGYRNTTVSARLDGKLSDSLRLGLTGRYINGRGNYPDFPMDHAVDNGIHRYDSEQFTGRAEARWQPLGGKWEHIFGVSSNTINRDYIDQITGSPEALSNYNGRTAKFDWQGNYAAAKNNTLTVGIERLRDDSHYASPYGGSSGQHIYTAGYYAQDQFQLAPRWVSTFGVRVDDHETFGTKATYRATSAYTCQHSGTRLKGTYATGFKAPSLFELYDPTYGYAKLQPETSTTYDIGIEQPLANDHAALGVTYFHNNYSNLIGFSFANNPNGGYYNVASAETHGVEVTASIRPAGRLRADLSYTYTHTQDANGKPLPRRPTMLYTGAVNYAASGKLNLNLTGQYVGNRIDTGTFPAATLPNYALFNFAATYKVSPTYRAFVRVDNLLDKKYNEVYSYATARQSLFGGVTVTL
ncbi:MAG TPA: TonB-dependent receptor [Capsulimonadaceae bacterium]|jgi:vitamin B12 transporter